MGDENMDGKFDPPVDDETQESIAMAESVGLTGDVIKKSRSTQKLQQLEQERKLDLDYILMIIGMIACCGNCLMALLAGFAFPTTHDGTSTLVRITSLFAVLTNVSLFAVFYRLAGSRQR